MKKSGWKEIEEYFDRDRGTVRRWIKNGTLPKILIHRDPGGRPIFFTEEYEEYVKLQNE